MQRSRTVQLETRRASHSARTVPATLSSEYPVDRGDFVEILKHGRENVDLSRAPLPLIEQHDSDKLNIGVIEDLHLAGGKLRGNVRFGKSQRAMEVFEDVEAGIVRNLSVGYTVDDYKIDGNRALVTRWTPLEVSLVSVPADPQAGLNRSYPIGATMSDENAGQPTADNADNQHMSRSQRRAENREAQQEQDRVHTITEIARQYRGFCPNLESLAMNAIRNGDSEEDLRKAMLRDSSTGKKPLGDRPGYGLEFESRSGGNYSITRALQSMIDPNSVDAGYEREISQEIARRSGRKPRGMYIPMGELQKRDFGGVSVGNSGSLVGTEHLGGSFIEKLYNKSVVMGLQPTILSGLTQNISIPKLAESAAAYWLGGDGDDSITESTLGFDALTLSPKTVGALVRLSRRALIQSEPSSEQLIRNDLAAVMAAEIDRAALQGSGSGDEPAGVTNVAGVNTGSFAGAKPTFLELVEMETALRSSNVDRGAYVTTPALAGAMKSTTVTDNGDAMIWRPGQEAGTGIVNGSPAAATNNAPADTVILGNWSDLVIGMWGGLDIEVNPYESFSKGVVAVRAFASLDFGVRHEESFNVYTTTA